MKKEERKENPYNNNKNHVACNRIGNTCSKERKWWDELGEES
jgi:hypothetical protein